MKHRRLILLNLLAATSLLIGACSGCAWSIGGGKKASTAKAVQPTRGQELIDLQKAHDQGVISAPEFEQMRQQIMQR